MCTAPNMLSDGQLVACRKCEQCKDHRVDDWVGRCIAESKTSVGATSITLTYGRVDGQESHAAAAILTYSHVQKYFKQLRNRGYPCRYLVTGEMGSKKGRTHWHGIVFWKKKIPTVMWDYGENSWHPGKRDVPVLVNIPVDRRFNEPCWPHGFSHWEPVRPGHMKGSIRYACKYIHKDVGDAAAQSKLAMSKNPPIGAEYFERRAQKFVEEGISPQDRFYTFPNDARQRKTGKPVRFRLAGKSADLFCQHFIDKWRGYPAAGFEGPPSCPRGWHYPHSEWLEEYEDRQTRDEWDRDAEFAPALKPLERRWPMQPPFGYSDADIVYDGRRKAPAINPDKPGGLWYFANEEGTRGWRDVAPIDGSPIYKRSVTQTPERLIPSQWVERLALRGVFWMTLSVPLRGRWTLAKTQPGQGKAVWLRSLME